MFFPFVHGDVALIAQRCPLSDCGYANCKRVYMVVKHYSLDKIDTDLRHSFFVDRSRR